MSDSMQDSVIESCKNSTQECEGDCAFIDALPDEILEQIFCYLNIRERLQTELVCRRWRDIGQTVKWTWPTELDIWYLKEDYMKNKTLTNEVMANLLSRCGTSLKKLVHETEQYGYKLTSKVFDIIGENCPNLTEIRLGLGGVPADDLLASSLMNLSKRCTKLKKVHIRDTLDLDDTTLSLFLKHCHSLEYLVLSENYAITEECLVGIHENLKGFYVYNCEHVNIAAVCKKLLDRRDPIEQLCLHHFHNDFDGDNDTNDQMLKAPLLMKILHNYRNTLKTLYLVGYTMKTPEWYGIPNVLQNVEVLSLCGCVGVNDNLMTLLADNCVNLRELDISETQVSDVGISALAKVPSLRVLDVSDTDITGEGIQILASQGRLVKFYARAISREENFLEDSCMSLASCCPSLRVLDVSFNESISDRLVAEFRTSLERGLLIGPVSLHLRDTSVNENVEVNENLRLCFRDRSSCLVDEITYTEQYKSCPSCR